MKTNQVNTASVQPVPAPEQVETRTGIFSRLHTIKLLTWFFDILLKNVSEKCIANLYKEGDNTMLSILTNDTHIHIAITQLQKGGESCQQN